MATSKNRGDANGRYIARGPNGEKRCSKCAQFRPLNVFAEDRSRSDGRSTDPIETFFDDVADAQAMSDERLRLLAAERRRLTMVTTGAVALPSSMPVDPAIPTAMVVDDERSVNGKAAVVEIGLDFERNRSTLTTWG